MSVVALKNAIVSSISSSQLQLSPLETSGPSYGSITSPEDFDSDRAHETGEQEALIGSLKDDQESSKSLITSVLNKFDPRVMSDTIIGLSDGLTVPFALTAGLSSLGDSKLVLTGGFAELISGAISMGLGGFLAAKSESQYYHSEVRKEKSQFFNDPDLLELEIMDILNDEMGITDPNTVDSVITDMQRNPKSMVSFVIKFGKGLDEPAENRQVISAITIGSSYFIGGFIPLVPYFFVQTVQTGLILSCIVMAITLFWFGYVKTVASMGSDCGLSVKISEGIQMMFVGGFAAGSAWLLVKLIG